MHSVKRLTIIAVLAVSLSALSFASNAQVFISEGFESFVPGTNSFSLGSGWSATTAAWTVQNTPGLAASGNQYLNAPSRIGFRRFVWFDSHPAFLARTPGNDVIVSSIHMFVPASVTQSTFGGIFVFDAAGKSVGVLGIDMLTGQSLSNATGGVSNIAAIAGGYNDLTLRTNFASGIVQYLVNGALVGTRTMSVGNLASGFGDLDMYNNGDVATQSVAFRFDDYKVEAIAAVPEPGAYATLAGIALTGVGIVLRRRRA